MAKKPAPMIKGLFGFEIPADGKVKLAPSHKHKARKDDENEMVLAYGRHPNPVLRCKDCDYLYFIEYSRKYFKCNLRKESGGAATDHRKHWPACTKFVPLNENKSHEIL